MSLQWLWRSIAGVLLILVCLAALFFPQINSLLLSVLTLLLILALVNSKPSSTVEKLCMVTSVTLLFVLSVSSLFPGIRLSPYYLQLKLYRFYTLPSWFFTMLLFVFVFPGYSRFRELASSIHTTLFSKRNTSLTLLVLVILLSQFLTVGSQVISQGLYTLEHRRLEPTKRYAMRKYGVGDSGWFYNVGLYWQRVIPNEEGITIGIPPQGDPWIKSGNIYYVLYFMFPRKVEMLTKEMSEVPSNLTHLVIARGETDHGDFGWPTRVIPKDQIQWIDFYNPFTNEEWRVENMEYNPEAFKNYYGVIHLKRGNQ